MSEEKLKFSDEFENYIASFLLGVMVIASTLGVLYRYVIQEALSWSEELSRFSFIWFCYFAASYAVAKKSNIIIDLLDLTLAKRAKWLPKYLRGIGFLCWLGFSIFMIIVGFQYLLKTQAIGEVSAGLKLPISYVYASVPIGFALMTFRLFSQLIGDIRRKGREKQAGGAKVGPLID
jgi:TRAP-type C4-dicarboxylate transport system permease small subunit